MTRGYACLMNFFGIAVLLHAPAPRSAAMAANIRSQRAGQDRRESCGTVGWLLLIFFTPPEIPSTLYGDGGEPPLNVSLVSE